MKRASAYISLVLILVIVGAVLCIRLFVRGDDAPPAPSQSGGIRAPVADSATPAAAPTPSPAVPEPIVLTPPPPSATVEPLPTPAATAEPVQTPEITSTPVATAMPVQAEASGSFSSDTGTYLNMMVEWKRYTDETGAPKLQVTLSATHYSLRTDEVADGLEININGEVYRANTPAIRYDGRDFVVTPMHTFTVDAPVGAMRIAATWHYRGSYSGKELGDITATDTYYPQ